MWPFPAFLKQYSSLDSIWTFFPVCQSSNEVFLYVGYGQSLPSIFQVYIIMHLSRLRSNEYSAKSFLPGSVTRMFSWIDAGSKEFLDVFLPSNSSLESYTNQHSNHEGTNTFFSFMSYAPVTEESPFRRYVLNEIKGLEDKNVERRGKNRVSKEMDNLHWSCFYIYIFFKVLRT